MDKQVRIWSPARKRLRTPALAPSTQNKIVQKADKDAEFVFVREQAANNLT
jgi:hypothetical protein